MALITMHEILKESVQKKYAVGGFDTLNYAMTEGILNAAEERNRPVILMVIESLFHAPHAPAFFQYLTQRAEASSVPVALLLDHGSSFQAVMQAIRFGCTSVMLDASKLPLEENIARTRQVVQAAHACGISVEAEVGHVAGHEGNMIKGNDADQRAYTKVEQAVRFVEETSVDALAIAIGTVHGKFKGTPCLDLERLRTIRAAVSLPLVMHGGSGLSPQDFQNAIDSGINKVNIFTTVSLEATRVITEAVNTAEDTPHFHTLVDQAVEAISTSVTRHIDLFGTQPLEPDA